MARKDESNHWCRCYVLFLFFFTWGNPHGHLATLLGSGGVMSDSYRLKPYGGLCNAPGPLSKCSSRKQEMKRLVIGKNNKHATYRL